MLKVDSGAVSKVVKKLLDITATKEQYVGRRSNQLKVISQQEPARSSARPSTNTIVQQQNHNLQRELEEGTLQNRLGERYHVEMQQSKGFLNLCPRVLMGLDGTKQRLMALLKKRKRRCNDKTMEDHKENLESSLEYLLID
ncbi:hypothetical protein V6N11_043993 [Hibiscus sabdariffa]|uniref:Uncharacterized protein n=1 Tax=Hibiscus sabdariffa TaxID=183260 RepID=A0ABR2REA9_9ROSI